MPRLSKEDIETRAEAVLAQYSMATLKKPTRTPLLELVEQAQKGHGLIFDATQDLGSTQDGRKILGVFQQEPLAIRVDISLANDDTKFRFTVAHEFGHLTLHAEVIIGSDVGLERAIQDTALDFDRGHKNLETPRDWIEWQANYFAGALLMPRLTIGLAVKQVQDKLGITSNRGRIILEGKAYSYRDLNQQLAELCLIYIVSKTAMQNRLNTLGILVDRRDKNTASLSSLFRRN